MPDIHPIRLRGPWQYEVLVDYSAGEPAKALLSETSAPQAGKLVMPTSWSETLGADFRGRVRYQRNFGCPSGLEPHETVYLVFEAIDPAGEVQLNGQSLGTVRLTEGIIRLPITSLLKDRNELEVIIEFPLLSPEQEQALRPGRAGLPGGLWGEVRLEIQGV